MLIVATSPSKVALARHTCGTSSPLLCDAADTHCRLAGVPANVGGGVGDVGFGCATSCAAVGARGGWAMPHAVSASAAAASAVVFVIRVIRFIRSSSVG